MTPKKFKRISLPLTAALATHPNLMKHQSSLPHPFAIAILAAVLTAFPLLVRATTFNIASGDVAGLIAAINMANGTAGPDTINLAPAGTYTLIAVDNTAAWQGPSGLPTIT